MTPLTFCGHTYREGVDTSSPKFIVTLDGVPSPLGNLTDGDMELDDVRPLSKVTEAAGHVYREPKVSVLDRLQGVVTSSEGVGSLQLFYLLLLWVKPDFDTCNTFFPSFIYRREDGRGPGGRR